MPPAVVRTSDILVKLAGTGDSPRVSVRTIVDALGERAYALLIVVLGLPNCLPMPPPIPLICGILLMFVAAQIIVGWPAPWLPKRLLDRSIAREDLVKAASRAVPWLKWLEKGAKPRLAVFDHVLALRLMGVVLFLFSRSSSPRPSSARSRWDSRCASSGSASSSGTGMSWSPGSSWARSGRA